MYTVNAWFSTLSDSTKIRENLVILQILYFDFRHFQYTKTLPEMADMLARQYQKKTFVELLNIFQICYF